MDAVEGKNVESVVILSLSKHWRAKASAHVLRQAQDDTQPSQKQSVLARYEATSKLHRFAYIMHEQGCHAEPVEAWRAKASPRILRQAQDDTPPTQKQSVIARYEAISELLIPSVQKFAIGFLICLFISANSSALNRDTVHKYIEKPLYIVDGLPLADSLVDKWKKSVDPNTIISIAVLKRDTASPLFETNVRKDIVIIVTKSNAVKRYQKKFSTLSEKYRDYLKSHQNNDTECGYIADGFAVDGTPNERISKLFQISGKEIISFDFMENTAYDGGSSKKYIAVIVYKQ